MEKLINTEELENKDKISTEKILRKIGMDEFYRSWIFDIGLKKEYKTFEDFDKDFASKICYSTDGNISKQKQLGNYIKTYHKDIYAKYFMVVEELYDFEDSILVRNYLYQNRVTNIMFILSQGYTKNSKLDPVYKVIIKDAKVFMKNNNIVLE